MLPPPTSQTVLPPPTSQTVLPPPTSQTVLPPPTSQTVLPPPTSQTVLPPPHINHTQHTLLPSNNFLKAFRHFPCLQKHTQHT